MPKKEVIAGIDEAGRGCLAGPVVAGAVILPEKYPKELLQDSKALSEKKREEAFLWITQHCDYAFGEASAEEIDRKGIKKATHLAMMRALSHLSQTPTFLQVDGRDGFVFDVPSEDFIKGDARFACIAAASIVAKVIRDKKMREYAQKYPLFSFEKNKGYGTKKHMEILRTQAYTPIHRKTFDPLRTLLIQKTLL